jgi:hypothetical protein
MNIARKKKSLKEPSHMCCTRCAAAAAVTSKTFAHIDNTLMPERELLVIVSSEL